MGERRSRPPAQVFRAIVTAIGFAVVGLNCGSATASKLATINAALLFGTTEIESHNLSMFPKWRHALRAFEEQVKTCGMTVCGNKWRASVQRLRGQDLMVQLRETNAWFNNNRYIADNVNWALPDYWATPFEFLEKAGGDCEDYAIAKYMMLRAVGVSADDMRIVVLRDISSRVDHAVLAVYVNGNPYILDNRFSSVVPANSLGSYQPVYSINEHGWWLHRLRSHTPTITHGLHKLLVANLPASRMAVRHGHTFAAQLASSQKSGDAIRAAIDIQARHSAILKGSDLSIRKVDLGAKGIWYRTLAGPFVSRSAATSLCSQLRAASSPTDCIVIAISLGE
jgi:predicted transglutaminase-like cysteine proteinase